jgi:hypothetical protein
MLRRSTETLHVLFSLSWSFCNVRFRTALAAHKAVCIFIRSRSVPKKGAATLTERSLHDLGLRELLHAHKEQARGTWGFDQLFFAALYFNPELDESCDVLLPT